MRPGSVSSQQGLSLLELLISLAIAGLLIAAISGVVGTALNAQRGTQVKNDTLQQARFAMQRMVNAVSKTRYLMIPLGENPSTAWSESQRNVLAVTLDPTLDRDKDGWADANNDKDFLDVNNNGAKNVGEPERIDEDTAADNTNDANAGIAGIDDGGNGVVDDGSANNNDEDSSDFEDGINGIDDDVDGSIDEDNNIDMNGDGQPGITGVDDDFDGSIDEGKKDDDDEDGVISEDWRDPVVYFLNGTTLMERMPNINPASGADYTEYPIADNVSQLLVKRVMGGNGTTALVDISLTLSPPGADPVTLNTRIGVGSGL
jgi:prepilin-type N-terminal cleavage/methylation domain-containing protein